MLHGQEHVASRDDSCGTHAHYIVISVAFWVIIFHCYLKEMRLVLPYKRLLMDEQSACHVNGFSAVCVCTRTRH